MPELWANISADAMGQERMARLVQNDRKASGTQISTGYNHSMQKIMSEAHCVKTLSRWDPATAEVVSAGKMRLKLQFRQRYWAIENKNDLVLLCFLTL